MEVVPKTIPNPARVAEITVTTSRILVSLEEFALNLNSQMDVYTKVTAIALVTLIINQSSSVQVSSLKK